MNDIFMKKCKYIQGDHFIRAPNDISHNINFTMKQLKEKCVKFNNPQNDVKRFEINGLLNKLSTKTQISDLTVFMSAINVFVI